MAASTSQNRHPRRRPSKGNVSPLSTHAMSLRKSGTFSSPTSVTTDICDLNNAPFMSRRSPTSPESLELLLPSDSSVRRVANLLKHFDEKLAGHWAASSSASNILNDPEVLPVPSFVLDNATLDNTPTDINSKPVALAQSPHEHASDSGLGSSVSGSKYDVVPTRRSSVRESINTSVSSAHSAVTRSFSALGASEEKHTLGEYACEQIHDTIIKPILAEESLKDFHPLIKDVPRRIGEKNICNLRDLEKTLVFLAPIRRYAAIMAATRDKQERGEQLDEMDYSRDENITLRGGLSHNGRPVELVREKNGRTLSIAEDFEGARRKRSFSDDEMDEDEVTRSMARRRKSDKPGDVMHTCRECKKEFKRPCDLTKHEKTHTRPWKCTEAKCKYADLGWPTEKERDRHMNDKHSAAPAQYKCRYPPCTYASKRESNCKQHMEKAHGWEYVRSKSNGRKKNGATNDGSSTTPPTPSLNTPQSATLATPTTSFAPSPQLPLFDFYAGFTTPALSAQGYSEDFRRGSADTNGSHLTPSNGNSPTEPTCFEDAVTPADNTINHHDFFSNCTLGSQFDPNFQQPTPAMSTGFAFEPLSFPLDSNLGAVMPHLSPLAQPDVTLFSPEMHLDEGFGDIDMDMQGFHCPTEDFTLFDAAPANNTAFGNTTNLFPDFNQVGGQFDSLYADPTTTLEEIMGTTFGSQQ